jgi:hypothetical protein
MSKMCGGGSWPGSLMSGGAGVAGVSAVDGSMLRFLLSVFRPLSLQILFRKAKVPPNWPCPVGGGVRGKGANLLVFFFFFFLPSRGVDVGDPAAELGETACDCCGVSAVLGGVEMSTMSEAQVSLSGVVETRAKTAEISSV